MAGLLEDEIEAIMLGGNVGQGRGLLGTGAMRAYNPTLTERAGQFLARLLGDDRGAHAIGNRVSGILGWTPLAAADSAQRAGEAYADGAPGQAAGHAALAAGGLVPFSGAASRAAMATAPRAAAYLGGLGVAGAATMGGAGEAEAQSRRGQQAALPPLTPPEGVPPAMAQRWLEIGELERRNGSISRAMREERNAINNVAAEIAITKARTEAATGAADRERQVADARAARDGILSAAPKPFHEEFPNYSRYAWAAPAVLGAATGALLGGRGAMATRQAISGWQGAIGAGKAAGTADELASAARLSQSYGDQFSKGSQVSAYAAPGILGGIEGAATVNMPDAYNVLTLPDENPQRRAMQAYVNALPPDHPDRARVMQELQGGSIPERYPARAASEAYFKDPERVAIRTGVGALEGTAGALAGTTLGKLLHARPSAGLLAEAGALQRRVSPGDTMVDDAAAAMARERGARADTTAIPPRLPPPPQSSAGTAPAAGPQTLPAAAPATKSAPSGLSPARKRASSSGEPAPAPPTGPAQGATAPQPMPESSGKASRQGTGKPVAYEVIPKSDQDRIFHSYTESVKNPVTSGYVLNDPDGFGKDISKAYQKATGKHMIPGLLADKVVWTNVALQQFMDKHRRMPKTDAEWQSLRSAISLGLSGLLVGGGQQAMQSGGLLDY